MAMDIELAFLSGLNDHHVVEIDNGQRLHRQCVGAFYSMQEAAKNDGIDIQVASGFRDYQRQAAIWARKTKELDALSGQALSDALHAVLRWSAMPGASRHHWGTDMDVYAPSMLGDQALQLEPWEYAADGPMAKLSNWLQANAIEYGFYWPYAKDLGGVSPEPWHLSYMPLACCYTKQFNTELLLQAWQQHPPAHANWLREHADALVTRYVSNITPPPE